MASRFVIAVSAAGFGTTLALAVVGTACSALVDSGGLSSGSSQPGEGGASSSSASSSSSSSSSSSGDAALIDASSSSSSGGGDASKPLCAEKNRFCTTFDDLTGTGTLPLLQKNGTGKLTASPFVSPPQAFESDVTPTSTDSAHAALNLDLGPVASTLHVEYDLQVLQAPTDYVETTFIRVDDPNGNRCALYLVLGTGDWNMNAGCPNTPMTSKDITPVVLNQWNHITWDIQADGRGTFRFGTNSVSFTLGGGGLTAGGNLRVVAGVYYAKPGSNRTRLVLDNLLIRD